MFSTTCVSIEIFIKLYNHSSALWYVCEVIKFAIIFLLFSLKFYSCQKRSVWIRLGAYLVEFQCSWLIMTDKTITDIRAHFQCKIPIWFQDFYEIWVIKYSKQFEKFHKAWKDVTWLEERQSLPELRLMCTVAQEWGNWLASQMVSLKLIGGSHMRSKTLVSNRWYERSKSWAWTSWNLRVDTVSGIINLSLWSVCDV